MYIYPDSCGGGLIPVSGGGGGSNKMPFWIADLLVSCGRMADSCKKNAVSKIAGFGDGA